MAEGSPLRCVGYIRCSTQEQGENGGGLAAQRQAIEHEAARRGWQLTTIIEDVGVSGGTHVENRPGGARVLALLRTGAADVLCVSKVDRLGRSLHDVAGLLEEQRQTRRVGRRVLPAWQLTACDTSGIDTTTDQGRALVGMLGVFGELERGLIRTRTREALRAKQRAGVRLGRVPVMADETRALVLRLHTRLKSWSAVAHELNRRAVPTAAGGRRWYPSTVRTVVQAAGRAVQPIRPKR